MTMTETKDHDTDQAVATVLREVEEVSNAADRILLDAAADNSTPNAAEIQLLRRAGIITAPPERGWQVGAQVRGAVAKKRSVFEHQQAAGTEAAREKLAKGIESAEAKLSKDGPKLREQIAELQAELDKLTGDVEKAQQAKRRSDQAIAALMSPRMLPDHVSERYNRQKAESVAPLKAARNQAAGRRDRAEAALALNVEGLAGSPLVGLNMQQRKALELKHYEGGDRTWIVKRLQDTSQGKTMNVFYFDRDAWSKYLAECDKAIDQADKEIADLDKQIAATQAEADLILRHYIPR
jgi:cytochrome c556